MSIVLRPDFEAVFASRITQTAGVAVAKTLQYLGIDARIKWPNDLLVREHKICGILAESSVGNAPMASKSVRPDPARRLDHVVLGVGMNANLDPEDLGVPDRAGNNDSCRAGTRRRFRGFIEGPAPEPRNRADKHRRLRDCSGRLARPQLYPGPQGSEYKGSGRHSKEPP